MIRKIIGTKYVENEEVLQRVNEKMNILNTIKRKKVNWIGYICSMNCPLKKWKGREYEEKYTNNC
jgi:hypothetical protein